MLPASDEHWFVSATENHVMTWISRFTLIAYLLGGWLLPAAHHHLHHDHREVAHVSIESTCGCPEQVQLSLKEKGQAAHAAPHGWRQATDHADACTGLCALCSARSLTSPTIKSGPLSVVAQPSENPVASDVQLEFPRNGFRSRSRGPPAIA